MKEKKAAIGFILETIGFLLALYASAFRHDDAAAAFLMSVLIWTNIKYLK